ncbi:hypothetical protein [Phormidium sp. CCY1219]|uniref:hypothetical protein n=1 Tax=Phormidium sp. CCY1219 TaxID=2886104 RepID=UPI002D1F91F7|nr:hypothetical protein [Phormidium sp. CCY1219]MEB3826521.1 hypothetical protein [Phormidium sp. CCY1219]
MVRKNNRFVIYIVVCSALGVILGGTASRAELHQCLMAPVPSSECLMQDPLMKTLEGMSLGLIAGGGAALGATWQMLQKEK